MAEYAKQLLMASIGATTYGVLFRMEHRFLPYTTFGGFLCWLAYLIGQRFWGGVFLPSLVSSIVVALYAELLARVCKEPSTPFYAVSVIPLLPGGSLFRCMRAVVEGDSHQVSAYGMRTLAFALGIAGGISIVGALFYFVRALVRKS